MLEMEKNVEPFGTTSPSNKKLLETWIACLHDEGSNLTKLSE